MTIKVDHWSEPLHPYDWGFRTGLFAATYPIKLKEPWYTYEENVAFQRGLKEGKEKRMVNLLSGYT